MSSSPGKAERGLSLAESLYCECVLANAAPADVALDSLCRQNPALADALRACHAQYRRAREALGQLGANGGATRHRSPVFTVRRRIARGGMGRVLEAVDVDLDRRVAMKVGLPTGDLPSSVATFLAARRRSRLLAEAEILAQLDHPSVVPLHELGVDAAGEPFLAMLLVEGQDLAEVIQSLREGRDGWTLTRVIDALRRVAETVAHAHARGVLHRDLKPGNIMLGVHGQVYVVDWGLARARGRAEPSADNAVAASLEARIGSTAVTTLGPGGEEAPSVQTSRRETRASHPSSPLLTMAGEVIGTPGYMPPEQARGDVAMTTERSDVWSLGAILYHVLAGHAPYADSGDQVSAAVIARTIAGPPTPLHRTAPRAPEELVAIANRALAADPVSRYPSARAFADDLGAWLEGRPVWAHRTGAWPELRKWVGRNPAVACVSVVTAVLLVAALLFTFEVQARYEKGLETNHAALSAANVAAARNATAAKAQEEELRGLADGHLLAQLRAAAEVLGPARPERRARFAAWLTQAHDLLERRPRHEAAVASLRAHAVDAVDPAALRMRAAALENLSALRRVRDTTRMTAQRADQDGRPDAASLWHRVGELATEIGRAEATLPAAPVWRLPTVEEQWVHDMLVDLLAGLDDLDRPGGLRQRVAARLDFADTVCARTIADPAAVRSWNAAIASIADPSQCPQYHGLRVTPQIGLLPIGRDPRSGLWEFAHLQSGAPADRDPTSGGLRLTETTGIVLVLLPGGSFRMGRQATDPAAPNFDPQAQPREAFVHEVALDPFFLSKYEMTQGQWLRVTGENPAVITPERNDYSAETITLLHPVGFLSWNDCARVLPQLDLGMPTEAQWEYGERGGTTTVWYSGSDRHSLSDHANLADATCARRGGDAGWSYEAWDDGFSATAPVGTFLPNPFGLHDVHGNAAEWCADQMANYRVAPRSGDGWRFDGSPMRNCRDAWPWDSADEVRSGTREHHRQSHRFIASGVRPARRLEP